MSRTVFLFIGVIVLIFTVERCPTDFITITTLWTILMHENKEYIKQKKTKEKK